MKEGIKMRKKNIIMKTLTMLLVYSFLFSYLTIVHANTDIKVFANNKEVKFDQPPIISDGRTLVPVRAISEIFDAYVTWDASTRTVTIKKEFDLWIETHKIKIGSSQIETTTDYKDGEDPSHETLTLDVPAQILNGRTLIPLRAMCEALNEGCIWNSSTRTIFIGQNKLDSSIGISDTIIDDMKKIAINIAKNTLTNPNSAIFRDWEIERFVTDDGFFVYCIVESTNGTDYSTFFFEERNGQYKCTMACGNYNSYNIREKYRYLFNENQYSYTNPIKIIDAPSTLNTTTNSTASQSVQKYYDNTNTPTYESVTGIPCIKHRTSTLEDGSFSRDYMYSFSQKDNKKYEEYLYSIGYMWLKENNSNEIHELILANVDTEDAVSIITLNDYTVISTYIAPERIEHYPNTQVPTYESITDTKLIFSEVDSETLPDFANTLYSYNYNDTDEKLYISALKNSGFAEVQNEKDIIVFDNIKTMERVILQGANGGDGTGTLWVRVGKLSTPKDNSSNSTSKQDASLEKLKLFIKDNGTYISDYYVISVNDSTMTYMMIYNPTENTVALVCYEPNGIMSTIFLEPNSPAVTYSIAESQEVTAAGKIAKSTLTPSMTSIDGTYYQKTFKTKTAEKEYNKKITTNILANLLLTYVILEKSDSPISLHDLGFINF